MTRTKSAGSSRETLNVRFWSDRLVLVIIAAMLFGMIHPDPSPVYQRLITEIVVATSLALGGLMLLVGIGSRGGET